MRSNNSLRISILAILGTIAFGTIGYKLIMRWEWFDCFYFTVVTITTIGYGEPAGMTETGRYFTVVLILTGVGTIGYALSVAARAVLEFELVSAFGKRKMFKDISKLSGHFIVCGCGRMGDATKDEVLRGAGVERARGLVCSVSDDPDNLYITLAARDINRDLRIVARANDEGALNRLLKAGADKVVSPVITGSNQMAQMLLRPAVADFIELATMTDMLELEMEQVEIQASSPFVGRALKDTGFRSDLDIIIIAIKRAEGHMLFNPSADTRIEANDSLVAIGSHSNLEALERLANTGVLEFAVPQHRL